MRILIADDHLLVREALCTTLAGLDEGFEYREAGDYDRVLEIVAGPEHLDIALVDLGMPGPAWRDALPRIRAERPGMPVVILSASEDRDDIVDALRLGASGYIPKSSTIGVMCAALELVLSGGTYLPPHILGSLEIARLPPPPSTPSASSERSKTLTPRQKQILAELKKGLSNKEIARKLNLSEGTVKLHVTALLKALNVTNRTQAVVVAESLGVS